jgi:hypothetical protein
MPQPDKKTADKGLHPATNRSGFRPEIAHLPCLDTWVRTILNCPPDLSGQPTL